MFCGWCWIIHPFNIYFTWLSMNAWCWIHKPNRFRQKKKKTEWENKFEFSIKKNKRIDGMTYRFQIWWMWITSSQILNSSSYMRFYLFFFDAVIVIVAIYQIDSEASFLFHALFRFYSLWNGIFLICSWESIRYFLRLFNINKSGDYYHCLSGLIKNCSFCVFGSTWLIFSFLVLHNSV